MKHVFISYHHDDSGFAEILLNKIKRAGFNTWIDKEQLHPGLEWHTAIDHAIKNSFVLIVIMTPEAYASEYVTYEWAAAYGAGVKVIPILYKDTKLHPRLETLQYLNFTAPRSRPWKVLINAIKNAMASTPTLLPATNSENISQSVRIDTIKYPPPPPEDVKILRKEIVYEYLPDGKSIFQRKHLKMQMLQNGIRSFNDRYQWSGNGRCIIKSLTQGFEITNQHKGEDGLWNYFDVKFPYPIHKDDTVEFTIEWELYDEMGIAIPFLSTMIDRETRYLLLRVILPRELAPKRAYCYEFANYIDTLPASTKETHWSPATLSISYEVPRPKKYHKYLIRWYSD